MVTMHDSILQAVVFVRSISQCDQFQETSNRLKWRKKTDIESEIMLQDDCRNMHIFLFKTLKLHYIFKAMENIWT